MTDRKFAFSLFVVIAVLLLVTSLDAQENAGFDDGVWALDWKPDSSMLAVGRIDGTIEIRDGITGHLIFLFQTQPLSFVIDVHWSPDRRYFAASTYDGQIYVWEFETRQLVHKLGGQDPSYINDFVWSEDSQRIIGIHQTGGYFEGWDITTGQLIFSRLVGGEIAGLDWFNHQLLVGVGNGISLADVNTGNFIRNVGIHDNYISNAVWHPDGVRAVTGSMDKTVRVWNVNTNQEIQRFEGHTDTVMDVDWHPNGVLIASVSLDGTLRIWNTETETVEVIDTRSTLIQVEWSPDGNYLAYAGMVDEIGKSVEILMMPGGDNPIPLQEITPTPQIRSSIWRTRNDKPVNAIAWNPDDSFFITGGSFYLESRDRFGQVISLNITRSYFNPINEIDWNSDGSRYLTVKENGTIDIMGGENRLMMIEAGLQSAVWTNDDTRIIAGRLGNEPPPSTLFLLDATTGQTLERADAGSVIQIIPYPTSETFAVVTPYNISQWEINPFEAVRTLDTYDRSNPENYLTIAAIHPNGTIIATGSVDGTIRVWDAETWELRHTLDGSDHPGMSWEITVIQAMVITDEHLFSVSAGGTIRGWKIATGELISESRVLAPVFAAGWSHDGSVLAYSNEYGDIFVIPQAQIVFP